MSLSTFIRLEAYRYIRLEYDLKKVYATFLSEIMIDTEAAIYM